MRAGGAVGVPPVGTHRPLRVGLYGGFGTGNTGNDATAAVTVDHLRRTQPGLDLRLITYGPDTAAIADRLAIMTISTRPGSAQTSPPGSAQTSQQEREPRPPGRAAGVSWSRLPLGPLRRPVGRAGRLVRGLASTWTALRSVDAVVVLGCGIFEAESTVGGRGWRAMANLYLVSLAASLGRHRLAYVGIGGTMLPTRAERKLLVAAMRRAERRTFRDAESKAALVQMGGGAPDDLVVADLVFAADVTDVSGRHAMAGRDASPTSEALPTSDATPSSQARPVPEAQRVPHAQPNLGPMGAARHGTGPSAPGTARPQVALGVMSFAWLHRHDGALCPQNAYLRALAETAATLVREGRDVVVFAGDVADRAAVDVVADEARAQLGADGDRVVTLYATTLTDQVPVLAAAEMVIGSRFHNAVTALMVGKAPLVVADRTKIRTLMHTMGLGDHLLEARTLTSPDLLQLVARARIERAATEERTAAAVEVARAGALRGLDDLDRLVRGWCDRSSTSKRPGPSEALAGEAASSDVSVA